MVYQTDVGSDSPRDLKYSARCSNKTAILVFSYSLKVTQDCRFVDSLPITSLVHLEGDVLVLP